MASGRRLHPDVWQLQHLYLVLFTEIAEFSLVEGQESMLVQNIPSAGRWGARGPRTSGGAAGRCNLLQSHSRRQYIPRCPATCPPPRASALRRRFRIGQSCRHSTFRRRSAARDHRAPRKVKFTERSQFRPAAQVPKPRPIPCILWVLPLPARPRTALGRPTERTQFRPSGPGHRGPPPPGATCEQPTTST